MRSCAGGAVNELDQALSRIHECGFEYGAGETNHASMVVGALDALGHKALIEAFLDAYLPRLVLLEAGTAIPPEAQSDALGSARAEDWLKTFEIESASLGWSDLLRRRLPGLLSGALADGMHAPDRLSRAVRNLEEADSPERRSELIFSLSYWASRYVALPVQAGARAEKGCSPARILAELDENPSSIQGFETLSDGLARLKEALSYRACLERADLDGRGTSEFLSHLCAEAAGQYLRHPQNRLPYLQGMIGASGFRSLLSYLDAEHTKPALGAALHCVAAVHSLYGHAVETSTPNPEAIKLAESWDEMRYRASCSLAEHVIELTEACWREDRIRPDDRFRMAAADAILELGFSHGGRGG